MRPSPRFSALFAAVTLAVPTISLAQTSDTWGVDVGTFGSNWSNSSNWAHGVVPGNGGNAYFTLLPTFTSAPLSIFQDLPTVAVNQISFDTLITYQFKPTPSTTNTITLTGDAAIDVQTPSINTMGNVTFGQQFLINIAGSNGLTKKGPGTMLIGTAGTYSGGTRINDGIIFQRAGDAGFGNASGSIIFDGGTVRLGVTAWTSSRNIQLNAGGGTIETTTSGASTLNGSISGNGNLYKTSSRGLTLNAANTYTGETQVLAGSLNLASNGSILNSGTLTVRDTLLIDNTAANLTNRISNSSVLFLQGASVNFAGNASAASSETFGAVNLSRGTTTIGVAAGTGQSAALSFGAPTRDTGGVVFFRGTGLGATPAANTTNITFSTAPALVGGGGTTPTNASIIPWAYGSTSATGTLGAAGSSFVTYGSNGVRPLDVATEYAVSFAAAAATDNVRITSAQTVNSSTTVNSLLISTGASFSGAGTINITSGALLNLNANTVIPNPIDFGSAEGIISAPASITFNGGIAGSGGISKQGLGTATFNAASTYSGPTVIGGGTALFTSSVASGAASAFGNSTSAIILAPAGLGTNGTTARLAYGGTSAASMDRNLNVSGRIATNNAATIPGFGVASAQTLNMNGSINLDASPLQLLGVSGSSLVLNGSITGDGPITDSGSTSSSVIRINQSNSFTGGAEMQTADWQIGADNALGTGMLRLVQQLAGQPTIEAVGGPRTLPNDVVCFGIILNYWQIAGSQDLTFTGSINLSGVPYTHTINNTALTTYAGVVHTGGFIKAGNGTLVLSNNNIYTGVTNVNAGTLRITNAGALGSAASPTTVASGAMLEVQNNALSNEPVTINGSGLSGAGAIYSSLGNNSVGAVTIASDATIGVATGTLITANVDASTGAQNLSKVGTGVLSAARVRAASVAVDNGTLAITPGRNSGKTSVVTALSVNTGAAASLDLGDNDLVVDYSGSSPISTIRGYLQTGYNAGAWNGTGITSAAAKVTPNTAIAYAEATDLFTTFPATFSGQTNIDNTSVLLSYTLAGDANFDRKVNTLDFNKLAGGFGTSSGANWVGGDFDYDGDIDSIDFGLLAGAYGSVMPTAASLGSVVPEPASLSLIALACLGLRRRR